MSKQSTHTRSLITMTREEVYGQSVRDPQVWAELAKPGEKVNGLVLICPPGKLTAVDPSSLVIVAVSRKRKRSTHYTTDVGRFIVHIDFESAKYYASDENAADFRLWLCRLFHSFVISDLLEITYYSIDKVNEVCEELRKRIASAA